MSDTFGDFLKEQQDSGTLTTPPPATPAPQQTTQALQAPQEDDTFGTFLKQTQNSAITQNAIAVNSQNSATNPETAAKAAVLARQLNMPQAAVETDIPHYENQAKLQKNNELLSKSPVLARWVGDNPDPARIAQDEFDKLSTIEKIWKSTKDVPYETVKGLGENTNTASRSVNNALAYIGNKLNDVGINPNRYGYWTDETDPRAAALKLDQNAGFLSKVGHMLGGLAGTLSQIVLTGKPFAATETAASSVTQSVTDAAVHGAKSMTFPAAVDAVDTAANVYDKTGDATKAFQAAQMKYATTTLGGIVPLGAPGNLATRLGSGFVSGVATGEASRQAMNLVLPDSMKQDFNPEDAVLGGLSAAFLAGTMGPRAQRNMHDTIRKTYEDAAKSEQAVKSGESIQALSELSANSKLRESDPDAFKDFVKRASEDTPLDSVYVDKAKLVDAFNQSGVTAEEISRKMPEVAKQLNDAASSDIRIPVEDYATHIAGSEMDKALLQELKSDPDGMTMKEGQEHYTKAVEQLQEQAQHIAELHNQDMADATDLQSVHQNILDQLNATGRYKPDVAKVNATIVSEFYGAQAARIGMKPSEFMAQHPLKINAENPIGEKLDQSSLRDNHIWKAVGKNENGPIYKGNGFTLDPVRAVPHETDFDAGGMTHIGLMGHVAHVVEGATPHIFAINQKGLKVGHLVADVKDGQIVGIHDITSYNKKSGLGANVAAHIAANIKEAVRVHEVLDQSRSFWEKIGAHEQDQYKNSSYDWQSINRYLDGKQGGDQARGDGAQDVTRSAGAHGLEARELTEAEIKELEAQGFKFNQGSFLQPRDGESNRGAFTPSTNTISLLKSADLSTFAHEAGHFFLETMGKIATGESSHPQIKDDFNAALKWMGVKDADTWNAMSLEQKREFHEKFARGWEQYLMEGKSPNLKMQQIFSRFRAWMISVYRNLRNLNVDITPEVRQVFDRMIATDASIHEAEQARSFMPLFKDSKEAGISEKAFAEYQQLGQDATDKAVAELQARSMKDMQWTSNAKAQALKDLQKKHDVARKEVQAQITKEVMSEPVNKARNWIKNGEMTNDKGELVALSKDAKKASKLNADAVKAMFPESALDHPDMSKLKGLTGSDGLHPDLMADMFGFRNGEELVRSLIENGDPKDRINAMTDQRMLESHGELVNPDSVEQAANEAVHNEARAKFMASGLKILTKSPLGARDIAKAAKEVADKMIAEKRVRDLNERQYLSAETKANKEAVSLAAKDPKGAVEAQRTALLNNRLAKSAADAIVAVQKGVDYLKKFDKESIRSKIDLEYRDQIDALLDRYDLRQSVSNKALDKRESLSNFVERQASLGLQTDIPQKLLDEANRMHYKDMPVEDFKGLVDSVKMIENLGRLKEKLLEAKHQRDLQTAADEAVKVMSGLKQHDFDNNRGLSRLEVKFADAKAFGRSLTTSLLKMEQVMDWLDRRDPHGPMNTYVFRPIADAGVKANDMMVKMKAGIDELVHKNLEDITKDKGKIYTTDKLIDSKTGKSLELTKKEMLDMAGHLGNESSWDKLLRGEKWDDAAARQFLHDNMRKGDWDYVAGIGKALESLWPAKLEMNRRLGITDAEKIQPRAFDTEHGTYDGWYWPMKYDPARSSHVADRSSMNSEAIFESLFTRESLDTDTGRMNTRNENYAAPVLLNIDSLPRIIADEIHDTAYREAVINAHEFVTHPDVRKAIVSAMSQQHYDQIRPWLVSIANDGRLDTSNMRAMKWMDSMAHQARIRATMVGLGFRLSTMLVHGGSALGESVAELGPTWMASGLKDFSNPTQWSANKDFIFERSGEMRNRMNEVDRDVREHLREIDLRMSDPATTAIQRGADLMKAKAYQGIAMLDMASALPTWKGAYNKAMEVPEKGGLGMSEQDAIYFADKTIRNAHGGTGVKDLAAIQRGPEMMKLFTMFYTFWNHNFNRIADTAKMATELPETYRSGDMQKFKGDVGSVILRTLIYTFGVQAMHGLLHPPKEEDAEQGWAKWAGKALVGAFTGGIPVVRDVAPYLMGEKDYGVTPAASMVKAVHDSSIDAMHASLGEDVSDKWLKHTINTAGYVFGLPTGQPAATTQFLYDLEQGNTNPQDAGDWWRGILTGDTKHH